MVNKKSEYRISKQLSLYLKFLHQEGNIGVRELWRRYPTFSLATIQRHATSAVVHMGNCMGNGDETQRKKRGRKRLVDERGERSLLRVLRANREKGIAFTSKRLQVESGLEYVSNRTVRRTLNKHGYNYLQARKKGLMSRNDHTIRKSFARKMMRHYGEDFWKTGLSFYIDGTSWVFKTNPYDQASTTQSRVWRKGSEGLKFGCTSKGKKAGHGGKTIHFFVSISYSKGVISCEQYEKLTGRFFAQFIHNEFPNIFSKSNNPDGNLFLQDGDPRQNSKLAQNAMKEIGVECFAIPPRSPDINPIENLFHLVDLKLQSDALEKQIRKESVTQFTGRVRETLMQFPINEIDAIIDTMPKRMRMVMKNGGQRLKY